MAGHEGGASQADAWLAVVEIAKDLQEAFEAFGAVEELLEAQANTRMLAVMRRLNDRLHEDVKRLRLVAGIGR